ncbi:MAG: DNA-binding response regulator [Ignavibacteria bacterium GWA2_55_11]|nr:MAG: DNA-binding response regulator [Ignavibacteria bacterium GWA2_55_11]OGU63433.1 MAG: DNA-binding response regulator [Ignavibacteria bacterium RIFCSPHIGHO2_02_FULL_56_12]OGU71136.1 MAG: DNA-binding response regulator [Ignavibacteria bacterium RIFCSPLOWO2_02_FULL_55_14]OGU72470.1 MAG: DNA-binding response regulator [Ignavibacteria bacterium RIFCSPLOWO2_12_FULL_56_21]
MSPEPTILVIDDESSIRRLLELTLESNRYRVRSAVNGRDGIAMAGTERPDLIILDLGLPDMDGQQVLRNIRDQFRTPVIILSVRTAESEIISCLDAGADDYLVKPFRTGELLARIRTALRRETGLPPGEMFTCGNVSIDLTARVVKKKDEIVHLTSTEYSLLSLFVRNSGRVLTHAYILESVWGPTFAGETQYTRVYVGQLRKKIEDDPSTPRLILTESGIGYRLSGEEE